MSDTEKQRLDQWLWQARFFKTRTLAKEVLQTGRCRLNKERITKPGRLIKPGDIITFPQNHHIRIIKIRTIAHRRGPAKEASTLYHDLEPVNPNLSDPKESGIYPTQHPDNRGGRPTKKDRRKLIALRQPKS